MALVTNTMTTDDIWTLTRKTELEVLRSAGVGDVEELDKALVRLDLIGDIERNLNENKGFSYIKEYKEDFFKMVDDYSRDRIGLNTEFREGVLEEKYMYIESDRGKVKISVGELN
ncbi:MULTISPECIES: hypothetical protein [Pontibacillus]|uniref:Uncharacterized protein n=1 Tax=Pontibacillus chungwhensis TaxID=265426 RepID=A0ABY8V903_9BACI|nr:MULTISPECIES: hypothetical protein [Pontibacillus]MCD5326155.1 hypothetical protein [Pontibacillus sp. HN14]WIG00287.1 hypothetical protein QNI29_21005 [Pontibacillus chungwhensis]